MGDPTGEAHRQRLRRHFSHDSYEILSRRAASLQTTVQLREPVPIHVEYYTVRVDEQQRVHFLGDVYRLDQKKRNPRPALRCTPESWLAQRRFQKLLERIGELEQHVSDLDACVDGSEELARALAEAEGKSLTRLIRRLRRMGRFAEDHANLVQHIRYEHTKLAGDLVLAGGAWDRSLVRQAVRVQRLVRALEKLTRRGQKTCSGGPAGGRHGECNSDDRTAGTVRQAQVQATAGLTSRCSPEPICKYSLE